MSSTLERSHEEIVTEVRRLHTVLTLDEACRKVGISRTTLYRYENPEYAEKGRRASREAKRLVKGECINCGTETGYAGRYTGNGTRGLASLRCVTCGQAETRAKLTRWTPDLIIERIREWASLYGDPPAIRDWDPSGSRKMHDEARALRFEAGNGYWPWFPVVYARFASWGAALEAAGFEARDPVGTVENMKRRRGESEREVRARRRREAVRPLREAGVSALRIATAIYEHWGYASAKTCYMSVFSQGRMTGRGRAPTEEELTKLREIP